MKMALPRKGLRGVEKIADTTAWTNSMAESAGAEVKDHLKKYSRFIGFTLFGLKIILIKYHSFRYTFDTIFIYVRSKTLNQKLPPS